MNKPRSAAMTISLAVLLSTILTITTSHERAVAGIYNRSAAVAYADQWSANDPDSVRNPDYPNFGNDCTNFASQVLYAGGMPTQGSRESACYPEDWWKPYSLFGFWHWPHSWSVAECQRQRMAMYSSQFQLWASSEIYNQQGGDILQIAEDWGPTPTHSRVIIGPGYDIVNGYWYSQLISQHTTDRKRRFWNIALDPSWPM